MNLQKINDWMTYFLVFLLWAPHATKECVTVCNGPVFISPTISAFFTPFVQMDISLHGFLMQLIWSPIFVLIAWIIYQFRDNKKYGKYFQLYIVRWVVFFVLLVIVYNLVFWGGIRDYVLPSFIF